MERQRANNRVPHGFAVLLLLLFGSEAQESARFVGLPSTVADVHRRVRYMQWVQRRLDVDHITLLDVEWRVRT